MEDDTRAYVDEFKQATDIVIRNLKHNFFQLNKEIIKLEQVKRADQIWITKLEKRIEKLEREAKKKTAH